ncbi:hypothetical protein TIFTF001_011194 [Ficus carica]|uniref:Uncharacterized protein n=1 Tax=Ficus carica TaxID=3494 RepID=A0AA88AL80_FICCA|nr:hypothetical protein TIFTF001_011194 [Ficus carica]
MLRNGDVLRLSSTNPLYSTAKPQYRPTLRDVRPTPTRAAKSSLIRSPASSVWIPRKLDTRVSFNRQSLHLKPPPSQFRLSIKGYRYELWCLARAAGIRYCVVFCDVEEPHCREWNRERRDRGEAAYDEKIFDDLVSRFERPDRRNRWDSPLFELFPWKDGVEKSSVAISEAVLHLTKKVDSKTRDVKILQPTIATQNAKFSEVNSLYELDRATQEVISALVEAQSQAMGGPLNGVSLGQGLPMVNISRPVGLPELRRLRRTFIKLTGQTSLSGPPPPSDADSAKRMFVDYLNRELGSH